MHRISEPGKILTEPLRQSDVAVLDGRQLCLGKTTLNDVVRNRGLLVVFFELRVHGAEHALHPEQLIG